MWSIFAIVAWSEKSGYPGNPVNPYKPYTKGSLCDELNLKIDDSFPFKSVWLLIYNMVNATCEFRLASFRPILESQIHPSLFCANGLKNFKGKEHNI